jgi:hypothetical protein
VQVAVVKLAAYAGGERLAQPALEIALVDIGEIIEQCMVEISADAGPLKLAFGVRMWQGDCLLLTIQLTE